MKLRRNGWSRRNDQRKSLRQELTGVFTANSQLIGNRSQGRSEEDSKMGVAGRKIERAHVVVLHLQAYNASMKSKYARALASRVLYSSKICSASNLHGATWRWRSIFWRISIFLKTACERDGSAPSPPHISSNMPCTVYSRKGTSSMAENAVSAMVQRARRNPGAALKREMRTSAARRRLCSCAFSENYENID